MFLFKLKGLIFFYIINFLLFISLIIICSKREHLLIVLLRIEYFILGCFFLINLTMGLNDLFLSLIFIVFTACEGALGLAILIIIRRTHGSDYFKSFSIIGFN